MTPKLHRVVDCLHAATAQALVLDEQAWEARLKRINHLPNSTLARIAIHSIHKLARCYPESAYNRLIRPYAENGYEVIGIGRNSTVLKVGDTALKIIRSSSRLSDAKKSTVIDEMKQKQSLLVDYIGSYALEQNFVVIPNPIKHGEVIAARQPLVKNYEPIEPNNHNDFESQARTSLESVKDFIAKSLTMAMDTDHMPDLLGASNIGFGNQGEFVVVDTLPISGGSCIKPSIQYLNKLSSDIDLAFS